MWKPMVRQPDFVWRQGLTVWKCMLCMKAICWISLQRSIRIGEQISMGGLLITATGLRKML